MSVLNGVHFCDNKRCGKSIPKGEFRLKGLCEKCWTRKRGWWRLFVVAALAFVCGGGLGLKDKNDAQDVRIEQVHQSAIDRDNQLAAEFNEVIQMMGDWSATVEERISSLGDVAANHKEAIEEVYTRLMALRDSIADGKTSAAASADYVGKELAAIKNRMKNIEDDITGLSAVPPEKLALALKSVVGLGVHATFFNSMGGTKEDDWMHGSGAIFKKEKTVDGYRYYVLTAYHVYQDYLDYQQNMKATLPPDMQKDAYPLVFIFDGNKKRPVRANLFFPVKWIATFPPIMDWIIVTFEDKADMPIIELADNTPLQLGQPVFQTGVFPANAPSIFSGQVAVLKTDYGDTTGYQGHCFPGQSGGAILNKDLKLVGMTLAMSVSMVGGDVVLDYGWNIVALRNRLKVGTPQAVKDLFGVK